MIKKLFEKYREIIVYIGVGLLTTLVAYGVRFAVLYPFASLLSIDLTVNNTEATVLRTAAITVGWVAGVIFAFFTNKSWVFQDKVSEKRAVWVQFGKFTLSRASTYFVEWALGALVPMLLIALGFVPFTFIITIDADMIATAISIVLVTVLNYILSKLLVFTKKK